MSYENVVDSQINEKASAKLFFRKRRGSPICASGGDNLDYKNPEMLKKFISEGGRM